MKRQSSIVEEYFQRVIKKSWTWNKLTREEKLRFLSMDIFGEIRGADKTRIDWLITVYAAFLAALGYKSSNWNEDWRA